MFYLIIYTVSALHLNNNLQTTYVTLFLAFLIFLVLNRMQIDPRPRGSHGVCRAYFLASYTTISKEGRYCILKDTLTKIYLKSR